MDVRDLLPDVLVEAPEVPDFAAEAALARSAREFCRRSLAWRQDLEPLDLERAEAEYELDPPAGAEVADLLSVTYRNRPLDKTTTGRLDAQSPGWRTAGGNPTAFTRRGINGVILDKMPPKFDLEAVQFHAALMPARGTYEVDELVMHEFEQGISAGAMYYLFKIPGKVWTDNGLAAAYLTQFDAAIAEAKSRAADGFMTGVARTIRYGGY